MLEREDSPLERSPFQIRLLGTFEVLQDGELLDLHHRKADLLFACLVIFGNWTDRSLLMSMIFPDAEPTSLDKAVGALRKQLGEQQDLLEVRMGKLRLNLKDADCDLTLFDRLIKQNSNESALRQAIKLYGGSLLPQGETESISEELHQWLYKERFRRETLFRDGLERAIQLAREAGRPEDTFVLFRRYAQEFPKSERAWTQYLRATHECGDRLEGITAYEQYRAALHAYALRPIPHIEAAYRRLLTESSEQDRAQATEFPKEIDAMRLAGGALRPDDPRYIMRPADRLLSDALRRRDTSIILVKGPRETGKSSLVIRSLHQEQSQGALTLLTDFKAFPRSAFEATEDLCLAIIMQLGEQLAQIKGGESTTNAEDEARVSKMPTLGLEQFIHRRVLNQNEEASVIWAMDRVDRLFGTPSASDFFSLLRSWHDKRTQLASRSWRRLKIVVVTSTEATLFLRDLKQSPFNVGLRIDISDFNREEAQSLNEKLGEPLEPAEQNALYELLGGHPCLMGLALQAVKDNARFSEQLPQLDKESGPFGEHLQHVWGLVCSRLEYRDAVRDVLAGKPCATEPFLMLRSAGILAGDASDTPRIRCPLYARFLHRKKP